MKGKRKLLSLMAADEQRSLGVLTLPDRNRTSTRLMSRTSDDRIVRVRLTVERSEVNLIA